MQGETIMSVPSGVTRIVFGGNLDSGEVWQCGYWIQGATPSSNAVAATLASLVYGTLIDATSGPINMIQSLWNSATSLEFVKENTNPTNNTTTANTNQNNQHTTNTQTNRNL